MDIYVVRPGDTLYGIARNYGLPMSRLLQDNQLPDPSRLVVGQTLVIRFPVENYTVRAGDTLSAIAAAHHTTVRVLQQNNPFLKGGDRIYPGQRLVLSYLQVKQGALFVNGYAYPSIEPELLRSTLPFLSDLTPFTWGFTPKGTLIPLADESLVRPALLAGVRPVLHLSSISESGQFNSGLARDLLQNRSAQETLVGNLQRVMDERGYRGLDVDFEYIGGDFAGLYADFVDLLRESFSPQGIPVTVALAPKTFAAQPGELYEGHDYRALAQAADYVLLMTYEWGYTWSAPMAVAPIRSVRQVVEYALTEMPGEQIFLGIPNYGYDWPLPHVAGTTKATSLSNQEAVELAGRVHAAIRYDGAAQSPWFRYTDGSGREHEVWFEDARSIRAKLSLAREYGLRGVSYWNLNRPFPQNWTVLSTLYDILEDPSR